MNRKPLTEIEVSDELLAKCNGDNQFDNFERVFRKIISVPKAEVLKREKKDLRRSARKRAGEKRG